MKKRALILVAALVVSAAPLYAGNGDLIVDGSLGVGTASPQSKLHVGGSIAAEISLGNTDYGGSNFLPALGSIQAMQESGGNGGGLIFKTLHWGSSPYLLTEKMRIDQNGNVGIGTTSPRSTFHVVTPATSGAQNLSDINRTTTNWVRFTNPQYSTDASMGLLLRVFPDSDVRQGAGILATGGEINGNTNLDLFVSTGLTSSRSYSVLRINGGNGYVGIGTTNPAQMLEVVGGILGRDINGNTVNLTSDSRFKKNLLPVESPLNKVLNLNGLTYEWKTDEYKDKGFPEGRHFGVIAQEIEKVLPEVVNTAPDGSKAVAYTEIIPVLIEAIKEQQKRIELLEKRLAGIGK